MMSTRRTLRLCLVCALLSGGAPTAAWAAEAVSFQSDPAHSGFSNEPLVPPLGKRWQRDLGHDLTAPLVAAGKVFVVLRPNTGSPELVALDQANGADVWRRALPPIGPAIAYGGGRVYLTEGGRLRALAADSGREVWSVAPPTGGRFLSPPVAADGMLYATGSGVQGSHLYELSQSDGSVSWTVPGVTSKLPAVDAERVYIETGCLWVEAFDRDLGTPVWSHRESCPAANPSRFPPAVHRGRVYVADAGVRGVALDAATGAARDGYQGTYGAPAFGGAVGAFRGRDRLQAQNLDSGTLRWSFERPSLTQLHDSPLVVGNHAYVRADAQLFALSLDTGAVVWESWLSNASNSYTDLGGMNAGQGLLVVTHDDQLIAFHQGPNGPGLRTDRPRPAPRGARVSFRARPKDSVSGQPVRLIGELEGTGGVGASLPVELEADSAPFDRFQVVARTTIDAFGKFSFRPRPLRNTRYRVIFPAYEDLVSQPVTVYADYGVVFRFRLRGLRLTTTATLVHAPDHRLAGRILHFYLVRRGARAHPRKASRRLRRVSRRLSRARATFTIPRSRRRYFVLVCVRERRPDVFGRRRPIDRVCGRPRLR